MGVYKHIYLEGGWYITLVFLRLLFSLNALEDMEKTVDYFPVCHEGKVVSNKLV